VRSIRRIMLLGASAAVAAALLPAGAQAMGDLHAACQFTGATTSLSPAVQYVGNASATSDRFAFTGTANCAGEHNGAPVTLTNTTLNAAGSYSNTVCGTGTAWGWSSVNGITTPSQNGGNLATDGATLGGLGTASFTLPFTAGQGTVVNAQDPTHDIFNGAGAFADASGTVNSFVNISPSQNNAAQTPDPNNPNGGDCVTQFNVAGAFLLNSN